MTEIITRCDVCRSRISDDDVDAATHYIFNAGDRVPNDSPSAIDGDIEHMCKKCEAKLDEFVRKMVAKKGKL